METVFITLSETETLIYRQYPAYRQYLPRFELYSMHENTSNETKIGTYAGGKWLFDDRAQRNLFFVLFNAHKKQFGKVIKVYNSSINSKDRPKNYVFTCAKRKFNIKVTKIKRSCTNFILDAFYGK
jgi:hypothetical protein